MPEVIDYDALAKQAGAISSAPPPGGAVDYDALAREAGAIQPSQARTLPPVKQYEKYKEPEPRSWADEATDFLKGAVSDTASGLLGMAKRVSLRPQTSADKAAYAAMGPLGPLVTDIARGHIETGRKAITAAKQGKWSEAAGYGAAAALPVIGPMAASLAETAGGNVQEGQAPQVARAAGQAVGRKSVV